MLLEKFISLIPIITLLGEKFIDLLLKSVIKQYHCIWQDY